MNELMSAALGRRVVAVDTAEDVGEVKAFVLEGSGRRITQLHVAGRKRSAELVNWSDLAGFGPDAVMVASQGAVTDSVEERADEMVRGHVSAIGARVLDTDGFEHGRVTDIEFDSADGTILAAVCEDARWPGDTIRGLGSYALIIDAPSR
ncbi:MAG: PRC-barrel domain-containing protein [Candidatus Nanopelagicales bacterium]